MLCASGGQFGVQTRQLIPSAASEPAMTSQTCVSVLECQTGFYWFSYTGPQIPSKPRLVLPNLHQPVFPSTDNLVPNKIHTIHFIIVTGQVRV